MLGAMSHLALTLSDLKASEEKFYKPVLEFLGYSKIEEEEGMTLWLLESVFAAINLWQASLELKDRPHERYAPGFHHFAFAADNREQVDALHDLLVKIGATVLEGPAEYDYTPGYYAVFFTDPDGLKFELAHVPPPPE